RMRKNDGRAVPNFISQALNNQPVTIYGDGKQTRSFGYVDDLVSGILLLMGSELNTPVNIGNPVEQTLIEAANLIIKISQSKSGLIFEKLPIDDPKRRQPDISLAKKELGWEPIYDFETGLTKTIDWFKQAFILKRNRFAIL
ncbi:MAG: SDR family NAD-dependent epimerase/dehydratase, partial [Candidatus Omnitrophota bacterium]